LSHGKARQWLLVISFSWWPWPCGDLNMVAGLCSVPFCDKMVNIILSLLRFQLSYPALFYNHSTTIQLYTFLFYVLILIPHLHIFI
jgi:hypothetical protein